MNILVSLVEPGQILPLRDLYRQELNCQIIHDSAHSRENCVQSFLITTDGEIAGYGSTWTGNFWMMRRSAFEFYVVPKHRPAVFTLFEEFMRFSEAPRIYAQTNDPFLGVLIYDHVQKIIAEHILFRDCKTTCHAKDKTLFRPSTPEDKGRIFEHHVEPVGDWVLEKDGGIIATGGVLHHYNPPYGDIFMEVDASFRREGFGQFLVQELKKVCIQSGRIPVARTRPANIASRRTLEASGFAPCGRLIHGDTITAGQKGN